jgi:EAL domain-containing protein (putative c-di-GMP-specific phosphodiesterase class I)
VEDASGCELGQGYYFAKPLEEGEIDEILMVGTGEIGTTSWK